MNDKRIRIILTLIGILMGGGLVFYLGSSVIPKALITVTSRASSQKISLTKSLLIGADVSAKADGEDKCVVNAFILDDEGKGIQGKLVQLSGLDEMEATTDSVGQAKFELTATTPGQYHVRASVGGAELKDEVTVVFR